MLAVVQEKYGPPDVLSVQDIDRPEPGPGEVLVRVAAASVNALDWHLMRGDPYVARPSFGIRAPRSKVRGADFAGTVETVGSEVTGVKPGDEVYGEAGAAFAEYVVASQEKVAAKPATLTFEQAAAVPLAANTALIALRDLAAVSAGQRVAINGASGGVGTFAVQIAKVLGGEVTAVCSTRNVALANKLGADHVVDYTKADFTVSPDGRPYDVVLDLVGNRSFNDLRRALTEKGTLVLSGGGVSRGVSLIGPMTLFVVGKLRGPFVSQRVLTFTAVGSRENLNTLRELIDSGQLTPEIDRTYSLREVPDAIRYLETEHARAKIVITT
jgi:NADPH:quinone reductase-like Zn-dependent oxidoreductase